MIIRDKLIIITMHNEMSLW